VTNKSELKTIYRNGLLSDVVPFWLRNGLDEELGGILTALDRDGSVLDTDKSVWAQGRSAWMFAEIYNEPLCQQDPARAQWLAAAVGIADFIKSHCFDEADGRLWFQVTRDGRPLRKRRYAFGESFAAIAFGELFKATGDEEYRELAKNCFQMFLDHNRNPVGVVPKFTEVRPTKGIGFPMITVVTAQELRDSIGLESATKLIDEAIQEIRDDFWRPEIDCVMETVAMDGSSLEHFDGRTLNPGHAIEGAWFIMNEGKLRGEQTLIDLGLQMLDAMWRRGWDSEFGGLLYFVGVDSRPVQEYWHDMKFWWNHNELIIATLLASQLSNDRKYAGMHRVAHDWAYEHFTDKEHGEWYGYLRRDGTVSNPGKGNLWKGPFHLPRMQLTCWRLLEEAEPSH
jgi:N-acylglucosamine 2-epimerase